MGFCKMPTIDIPGAEIYDVVSGRTMKLVPPSADHWCAGWLLYQHPDGGWVTLRKATEDDRRRVETEMLRVTRLNLIPEKVMPWPNH